MSIQSSVNKILGSAEKAVEGVVDGKISTLPGTTKKISTLPGTDVDQTLQEQSMQRVKQIAQVKQKQVEDVNKKREDLYIGGQKVDPNSQLYKVLQQKVETQGGFKDGK